MQKQAYFHDYTGDGWPDQSYLKPFFLAPRGAEWFYQWGNDSAGLYLLGIEGTEYLPPGSHRKDIVLGMTGNPEYGVMLDYRKSGAPSHFSKGDPSRVLEHVDSLHGTPLSIGLFIPFKIAWQAVKEFMDTEGQLPKSIEWVSEQELPEGTFPDPDAL